MIFIRTTWKTKTAPVPPTLGRKVYLRKDTLLDLYCIIFRSTKSIEPMFLIGCYFCTQKSKGDDVMWSEHLENGKVRFAERYVDVLTGKRKRVSITMDKETRQTWKAAGEILREKIAENQRKVIKHDVTLKELINAYREDQLETVKKSTYRRNFHTCNSFLRMFGEDIIVENLTAGYIKSVFLDTGKDAVTLNEYRTRFLALMRWGYVNDMLSDISFTGKFQRFNEVPRNTRLKDKFLEMDEFKALINGMDCQRWILLTEFMALSGARVGESIALSKKDRNYKTRSINIETTLDVVDREITDTPKTSSSIREVYMQKELYNVCKRIDAYMNRQQLMYGYPKSDLFFQDIDGGPLNYYSFNKYLRESGLKILGREKVTTHILRHTHTCILAEQGVPLETITRRLGHEDSKITRQVYLHVTKKMKKMDNEAIESVQVF